jgi:uncharacterized caspase-like protein
MGIRPMVRYVSLLAAIVLQAIAVLPAAAEKRVALVIGNSAYAQAGPLANPANDAAEMAKALTKFGFEVILGINLDRRAFDEKIRGFSRALANADTAVLFYAGHGLQVSGRNYLIPVDAELKSERDLDFETVSLDFVLRQMEVDREGKTNVIFLDSCRDNPLARNLARSMGTRSANVGKGLAEVQTGVGTFIAFSTQPGNVALDGEGPNSPFTSAFARRVQEPGRNLTAIMIDVRKDVLAATGGRQVPWDHSALTSDFYFQPVDLPQDKALSAGEREALQARIRAIEEELARKSDPQQTVNLVKLTQLKERVRQLEVAMREDQQRIFDVYDRHGRDNTPADSRNSISLEIGKMQIAMSRKGQEKKALLEQIAKLSADLGLRDDAGEAASK